MFLLYDTFLNGAYTLMLLQQQYPEHRALFAGTKDEAIAGEGPFLFHIDEAFPEKIGSLPHLALQAVVLVRFDGSLATLAAHLGPFLYQTIKGRECYFRFWDGRVLRKFLPTCSREQITTFFGPLQSFTTAAEGELAIQFTHESGKLQTHMIAERSLTMTALPVAAEAPAAAALAEPAPAMQPDPTMPPPRKKRTFLS